MKKNFIILIFFISWNPIYSQETPEFSSYYYQKKTLFEILPDTKNEIIFLGNSITDGCDWSELFKNNNIKNRGISGDITDGILFRLNEVVRSNPAQIFIMIGVNDLAQNKSPDYVLTNYSKILLTIKESSPKTEVFVQSILPVNDAFGKFGNHTNKGVEIKQINKQLASLARNFNYTYIDLTNVFSDRDGKLLEAFTNDGLHLTAAGYLAWKEEIKRFLK